MKDRFKATTRADIDQAKAIWDELQALHDQGQGKKPSSRAVAEIIARRAGSMSASTVNRLQKRGWTDAPKRDAKPNRTQREIPAMAKQLKKAIAGLPPAEKDAFKTETTVGTELTPVEIDAIANDIAELEKLSDAELDAMKIKEAKKFTILLFRHAQRRSDLLAMIPRDSSALATVAEEIMGRPTGVPAMHSKPAEGGNAQVNVFVNGGGNGGSPPIIDVTPSAAEDSLDRFFLEAVAS